MPLNRPSIELANLTKLGEGYEAETFAWTEGLVLLVLRDGVRRSTEPEQLAIQAALAGGIPAPRFEETVMVGDRQGTVMERIDGTNVLDLVGRRPWLMAREAVAAGRLHARLHAVPAPGALPAVHKRVTEWVTRQEAPVGPAAIAESELGELAGGDRLCHGDFHLGNLLLEPGGRRVVIDWGICAAGPAEADVARTLVLMRLGNPFQAPAGVRLVRRFFPGLSTRCYLRGYRSVRPLDATLLRRWTAVRAIEHLSMVLAIGEEQERSHKLSRAVEELVNDALPKAQ